MLIGKRFFMAALIVAGLSAQAVAQVGSTTHGSYYADDFLAPAQRQAATMSVSNRNVTANHATTSGSVCVAGYSLAAGCDSGCSSGCSSCDAGGSTCDAGCSGCDSASCSHRLGPMCCETGDDFGDPWTLFEPHCNGFSMGGWISGGYTDNGDGNESGNGNSPLGFNNVSDGKIVNQIWLWAAKEADTGGCGTDWGFRVDYVFGTDGPDTQAFGDESWDFGWDSSRDYGSAIPQAYVEYAVNDLSVIAGHFYTIIGYEVVQAVDNFFYSHAYTMLYGEPFTHTGFLASYKMSDTITVHGGWTAGWDSGFDNRFDASTFLGGVSLDVNEKTSLAYAVSTGDFGNGRPNNDGNIYTQSVVLERTMSEKMTAILQTDYGRNSDIGGPSAEWYGVNSYLLYEINPCWQAGARFEWFNDDDGLRVGGDRAAAGDYYALTLGLNHRWTANLTARPEIRWDWFSDADNGYQPYDDNTAAGFFTIGGDLVWTY